MSVLHKVIRRAPLLATQCRLKLRGLTTKAVVVDYGWVKLPYSDDGDVQELYYHHSCKEYFQNDMPVIQQYVKPGDFVLDIGANMGFVTAMLASLVGTTGKVISFEPSPVTFRKLERTIEVNNLKMVEAVNMGLGTEDAVHTLYHASKSSGNDTMVKTSEDQVAVGQITITPLDKFLAANQRPISFIKIDTEGYESQVLGGALETLQKHRPVIYIELCRDYAESSRESIRLLTSLGYDLSDIDVDAAGNGSNFVAVPKKP